MHNKLTKTKMAYFINGGGTILVLVLCEDSVLSRTDERGRLPPLAKKMDSTGETGSFVPSPKRWSGQAGGEKQRSGNLGAEEPVALE